MSPRVSLLKENNSRPFFLFGCKFWEYKWFWLELILTGLNGVGDTEWASNELSLACPLAAGNWLLWWWSWVVWDGGWYFSKDDVSGGQFSESCLDILRLSCKWVLDLMFLACLKFVFLSYYSVWIIALTLPQQLIFDRCNLEDEEFRDDFSYNIFNIG